MDLPTVLSMSERILNETAVRAHALNCSQQRRAGKFTRVGEDFLDEVAAEVESFVRGLRDTTWKNPTHDEVSPGELDFLTGRLLNKVSDALRQAIGRMIQNKVQRQPSVGVTLRHTY
jgi:hypothetical protein